MGLADMLTGGVVSAVGAAADALFTSDDERMKNQIESDKIGLEAAKVDAGLIAGQQEINKVEAASASVFVAGARPAAMWVCVGGMAYQYLLYPMLTWVWALAQGSGHLPAGAAPPPMLDIQALMVLMSGILGLSTTRTFEKVRGVSRESMK